MIDVDLTDDLGFHELVPYCDGHAVKLERLTLHRLLRRQVNRLFALKEKAEFPGSRPTVFSHETFAKIRDILEAHPQGKGKPPPFFITEKTDGKRIYLYFCTLDYTRKYQIVIDSKFNMFLVHFQVKNEFYEGTLLDGELVQDVGSDGKPHFVFYVFDCLECMGTPVQKHWFQDRLAVAHILVSMMEQVPGPDILSPFKIKVKKFYPLSDLPLLLRSQPPHASDGLIINQNAAAASCFHCPFTHKWKPLRDTTMDFLLVLDSSRNRCSFFTKRNQEACFHQGLDVTFRNCSTFVQGDQKEKAGQMDRLCHPLLAVPQQHLHLEVVECFYCPHQLLWKPKKIRRDKMFPNSKYVLKETIKIMKKPIFLSEMIQAWQSPATKYGQEERKKEKKEEKHGDT